LRRLSIIMFCAISLACLIGCQKSKYDILSTPISQIDISQHAEQLHQYDSPYTICYKNKDDTYSLYIFASPIQYKVGKDKYIVIDNTVIKSEEKDFVYENKTNIIKTYFPKDLEDYFRVEKDNIFLEFKVCDDLQGFSRAKRVIFTNMFGDRVSAVKYHKEDMDMVFYPTKAGIKTEIVLRKKPKKNYFKFNLKASASWFENLKNGYVLLKEGGENESVVYQPLVQYMTDKQRLDITTQINIKKEGENYSVEMVVDDTILENAEYPVKVDFSFEMYQNKVPDTSVYSEFCINSYLRNYVVLGSHPIMGEGWYYTRLRIKYFFDTNPDDVIFASYNTRGLCKSEDIISIYTAKDQWSSTSIVWDNKVGTDKFVASKKLDLQKYSCFNLTDFIKFCLRDEDLLVESKGFLLISNGNNIFSSNDNTLYSPFVFVHLKNPPTYFNPAESINPPAN